MPELDLPTKRLFFWDQLIFGGALSCYWPWVEGYKECEKVEIGMKHTPVLLNEVIAVLEPHDGGAYIDATIGEGGHTKALLEASQPSGKVLGLDQDPEQIKRAEARLKPYGTRCVLATSRFSRIEAVAKQAGFNQVSGILFDLGVSSRQIETVEYGLSFSDDSELDMRLSPELPHNAAQILNRYSEKEIADLLYRYGDRHDSRTLARKIVTVRRNKLFRYAKDLKEALGLWRPYQLAPLFQALRIAVNQEFQELNDAIPQAIHLLAPGGILAIISFHSGEDRIVKHRLRNYAEQIIVRKQIIRPSLTEIKQNPRSRSAILRIAVKR